MQLRKINFSDLAGPRSSDKYLYRGRKGRHGEDHMKTEAEMKMRQPQAKKFPEPPEAARGKKDPPLENLEGLLAC